MNVVFDTARSITEQKFLLQHFIKKADGKMFIPAHSRRGNLKEPCGLPSVCEKGNNICNPVRLLSSRSTPASLAACPG